MKDLMNAIRDELREELSAYIRPGDIFIAPHADYVPSDVMFPAIGIKDGAIVRNELIGECMEYTMEVLVIPWVLLQKPEASIMGDGERKKGVLDVADDIHAALNDNFLGIDDIQEAFSPSERPSEPMGSDNKLLQKKEILYRYIKQGDRP